MLTGLVAEAVLDLAHVAMVRRAYPAFVFVVSDAMLAWSGVAMHTVNQREPPVHQPITSTTLKSHLVERVFAHEVHRGRVEVTKAEVALPGLKHLSIGLQTGR